MPGCQKTQKLVIARHFCPVPALLSIEKPFPMHRSILPDFRPQWLLAFLLVFAFGNADAQQDFYKQYSFTHADTLRGMLRPARTCYDVTFYGLNLSVDIDKQFIEGYVDINYKVLADFKTIQLDLFANMKIEKVESDGNKLDFKRDGNAFFVTFPKTQQKGTRGQVKVYYSGNPHIATNPPWDGGFVWTQDRDGKPWVGVACEGDGASMWWPNKDYLGDESDSTAINITVPAELMCVANGQLRKTVDLGKQKRYEWFVSYPINNYNVTVNIADYAHFSDTYKAKDGTTLPLNYYVLRYNETKARVQFEQVQGVLACYEHYFDKYPFWRDGFALVETPYLGMEHQSAVAYGNKYMRGYLGGMIPKGMDWDYIIVHESGHEWFGNSISCSDLSEMWIHESFTTYMEALYVEYHYSYADAIRYLMSQRSYILNKEPILGPRDVNFDDWKGSDHYYKGAWILHTLRNTLQDSTQWFALLKGFYRKYAYSNITSSDFVNYVNQFTGKDYKPFFEQYLEYPDIPTFVYKLEQQGSDLKVSYKWRADAAGFNMPISVGNADHLQTIKPTSDWQEIVIKNLRESDFKVPTELYYVRKKQEK